MVCTVEPLICTRKLIIDARDEIITTAEIIFGLMSVQLEKLTKAADFVNYSSYHSLLSTKLQDAREKFK